MATSAVGSGSRSCIVTKQGERIKILDNIIRTPNKILGWVYKKSSQLWGAFTPFFIDYATPFV